MVLTVCVAALLWPAASLRAQQSDAQPATGEAQAPTEQDAAAPQAGLEGQRVAAGHAWSSPLRLRSAPARSASLRSALASHRLSCASILALIKPQFEVGKGQVGKGGVVRNPQLHEQVIQTLTDYFRSWQLKPESVHPSPVPGPKGNREFFAWLRTAVVG